MIRLGVNIDHVATVRNARGVSYPQPVQAAAMAELGGADNITCHLREDRRHIKDHDVTNLKSSINIPLNFEIAATDEMVAIACRIKPHYVTLVPEKRQELTTEGGLDLSPQKRNDNLEAKIKILRDAGILVSLFVEAENKAMDQAKALGAHAVEIHTGHFCQRMDDAKDSRTRWSLIQPFIDVSCHGHDLGLQIHYGHGLHYGNAHWLQSIPHCEEANIGHAIIARAIFVGLTQAVKEMKALLNDPQFKMVPER